MVLRKCLYEVPIRREEFNPLALSCGGEGLVSIDISLDLFGLAPEKWRVPNEG